MPPLPAWRDQVARTKLSFTDGLRDRLNAKSENERNTSSAPPLHASLKRSKNARQWSITSEGSRAMSDTLSRPQRQVRLPQHIVDLVADELRTAEGAHVELRPRSWSVFRLLAAHA